MMRAAAIQSTIRAELRRNGPCSLQALLDRLPQYSWSEIFAVIDQLSRAGHLILRHPTRFDDEVSIDPTRPTHERPSQGSSAEGKTVLGRDDVDSQVNEEGIPA